LSKERDIGNYLTAGFVGLMLIIFLYSLFIYISTKDHIYIWYLGYLLLMAISMPYANSHPFIQNLDFLFFDKQWWNSYFIVWHSPVYFFVGMFCIKYLNLKEKLPISYKIIITEIVLLSVVSPLLNVFVLDLEKIINAFQVVVLLLYLTCIITAYYMMFKGSKYARFYVLGWTFMIVHVFIFFATVNGYFPYNNFSRNALYFGVGLEVWMFSLALGDRINLIRLEKEQAQEQYIELVNSQNELLQVKVKERTTRLEEALEEIEAANSELMAQADQLAESNKAKDKLFSIIGHDLKSPIASLKVILELVVSKSIDAEEFGRIAKKFELKIDNVLFLLNNLFQWADAQKNGIITNPLSINLNETIIQNLDLLKTNAVTKQIKIINKVSKDVYVLCDPSQLNIIILNLINNAIKFTNKGGIIIIEAQTINDKKVQISTSDNGLGMNNKKLNTLFDPNVQASTEGTEGESGTGLGLTLCKDFIENNGGTIWVESEENIGSTFYFTLPLQLN
ncbi:MAG: sensor histidine kinase, partial [Bacteroidales bacterium]|nr:sensor histidine kinase [Bacteroidales bacterium]